MAFGLSAAELGGAHSGSAGDHIDGRIGEHLLRVRRFVDETAVTAGGEEGGGSRAVGMVAQGALAYLSFFTTKTQRNHNRRHY